MSYDYNALVSRLAALRSLATMTTTEALQESIQVFEELSAHCPMTPLLWMQYAHDMGKFIQLSLGAKADNAAAIQTRLQTLELGMTEFPGSAILQLHYCELLVSSTRQIANDDNNNTEETISTVQQALEKAVAQVGCGSHGSASDAAIVAQLYRVQAQFLLKFVSREAAMASLIQRAKTPLGTANDGLTGEVTALLGKAPDAALEANLEEARRWENKAFSRLKTCEEDVTMALHQEQISFPNSDELFEFTTPAEDDDNSIFLVTTQPAFEDAVLKGTQQQPRYWMGLGGATTAQAFLQYVAACRKFKFPPEEDDEEDEEGNNQQHDNDKVNKKKQQQLILAVLERGIAECPTVEALWLTYLKHLTWLWNNDFANALSPMAFKAVASRAVRNCPFSLPLAQQQLHIALLLANRDDSEEVMDPDELLQLVAKSLDTKFLPSPNHALDLYLTAIRVVQRRILTILATSVVGFDTSNPKSKKKQPQPAKQTVVLAFDQAELLPTDKLVVHSNGNKNGNNNGNTPSAKPLDDEAWQEVQDLAEEIRDMFEAASKRLQKDQQQKATLLQQQAQMEQHVLLPILEMTKEQDNNNGSSETTTSSNNNTVVQSQLEKAIRMHNPPHPDSYRALAWHVLHHGAAASASTKQDNNKSPGAVVSKLRQVRGIYQKAIQSVGKSAHKNHANSMTAGTRDYEPALHDLCHEYQELERVFGSEQSLANATRLMQKKLEKATASNTHSQQQQKQRGQDAAGGKQRRRESKGGNDTQQEQGKATTEKPKDMDVDADNNGKPAADSHNNDSVKRKESGKEEHGQEEKDQPAKKRRKKDATKDSTKDDSGKPPQQQPAHQQPKKHHKVKVGHIFHRAHPFTVRISNLALATEEMDLIECFKQEHKCGAVVHCRVQREKQLQARGGGGHKPKMGASKGWGLLQFEERESVEKCLALDQQVVLHDKTLRIERSHVPAVGIVPPGMHRPKDWKEQQKQATVNSQSEAKGDGDKSKDGDGDNSTKPSNEQASKEKPKGGGGSLGVLAFRPRGVAKKKKPAAPKRRAPK